MLACRLHDSGGVTGMAWLVPCAGLHAVSPQASMVGDESF